MDEAGAAHEHIPEVVPGVRWGRLGLELELRTKCLVAGLGKVHGFLAKRWLGRWFRLGWHRTQADTWGGAAH